ncbi:MAG: pantoate--beta-alanine ligase [Tumebacillaceae bacterium]
MIIYHTIAEIREFVRQKRSEGLTVGLVPTMGYLHDGHLSLLRAAKEQCDIAVMSIFVNPLQFGPNEDFAKYPRDLARDSELAKSAGLDALFAPSVEEMYPQGRSLTTVSVEEVTTGLCGASRPGHFTGVSTVVTKLFNIVQPDKAFFGLKDAQQVVVLQTTVNDLNIPVEIVPCPILRETDGLAMSSRNVFLSAEEREQALVLNRSLQAAQELVAEGERNAQLIEKVVRELIEEQPLANIDYVQIVSMRHLAPLQTLEETALLALAVRFGTTRLIDNTVLPISK